VVKTMRRNTDAPVSGGATSMSVEAPVMGVEQRGGVVWSMTWVNSGGRAWSMEKSKRARSRKTDTAKADLQHHERSCLRTSV
jgi:hypothetical protein